MRRALSTIEERLGPGHHLTGIVLHNLAAHYSARNRFTEAEPLAKRALSISEKTLTSGDVETGRACLTLGRIYARQGRHADAEALFQRSLSVTEVALGVNPNCAPAWE